MRQLAGAIRAAGFDLDGTLIDTAPDLAVSANAMLTSLGMPNVPAERIPAFIGVGVEKLVQRVLTASEGATPPVELHHRAVALFGRLYARRLFEDSRVYPGVKAGLRGLHAAGIRLCCLTNKAAEFVGPLLEVAGLRAFFAFTLSPEQEWQRKPSPALLQAACRQLTIAPANFLYVGDSRHDILAARAAHCHAVAVDYGYEQGELSEVKPDAIVKSLTDLIRLCVPGGPASDATSGAGGSRGVR